MSIFDGLIRRLGYVPQDPYTLIPRAPAKAAPITNPPAFLRADAVAEAYSIPDRDLPEAQLELYQRLTWVQIAVSTVASIGATTAFNVLSLQGEDTADLPNHPFELLLRRPNPLHSRAEFLEGTLAYYALTGNAYWWLNLVGGKPAELWLLPPHKVKPVPDGRMFLRGYLYDAGEGDPIPLELGEVVHFRRFHPLHSFVGLSPIEALAVVATGDMAAQKWNTNFFNKDNAKIPGILSFADPIPDPDWERMKDGVREQYGGTKRNLMMLRGAGQGGVQWLATSMSQADMQFLDGRTFTKEEIFAIYAPGLSSMLAVNATEANSVSGKRTFIEYGVWPHLVRVAEKITNDLLPLYGPNLVGEFEDIRVTDKQLELAEISAYSQTHTVDEVRSRYYQDEPLGDDRGNLLVTEVGKGLTPADPEAQEIGKELQRRALEAPQQQDAQQQESQEDEGSTGDDSEDTQEETSHDNMGQMQAEGGRQGERQAEVKALRRWLKNRRNPDPLKFKRLHLSADDVLDIAADMGIGEADDDAAKSFPDHRGRPGQVGGSLPRGAGGWAPSMSRADAEDFVANSAYKKDTFHVTAGVANERSIMQNGFDLNKRNFGRMWGDGVYVGTSSKSAETYKKWTGKSARTMTIKVNVQKPAVFDATGKPNFQHEDILRDVLKLDRASARVLWRKQGNLTKILTDRGFDALHIINAPEAAGGDQMVIFDPSNVVVING